MPPRAAVFLDRDGTLIEDRGDLSSPAQVVFYPDTAGALRRLQEHFRLFIVTNQPGIANGTITVADATLVNDFVIERMRQEGVHLEHAYVCPHRRDQGCACIKPNPHFLNQAAATYGLDLAQSFTVGDHPHDVTLADPVGATGIYLLTGHGLGHRHELPPERVTVTGIAQATDWIIACREMRRQEHAHPGLIREAARRLHDGGLVAFPTETVYGLGANALDARAVAAIFDVKRRPSFDPLIVHVAELAQARAIVAEFPEMAEILARHFWPGPLTMVLPKAPEVPGIVTAGLSTVAVRMPAHPLANALIREARTPVAAPSANLFGRTSPTTADHVRQQLGEQDLMILDGGPCPLGIESTIVALADSRPVLLRAGGTPREEIEAVVGPLGEPAPADPRCPAAPGMLARHYAPRTPLVPLEQASAIRPERSALLAFRTPERPANFAAVAVLSPRGDLREAAANLFAAIHQLDAMGLEAIRFEPAPEVGLGIAINDRLARAAAAT